MKPMLDGYIDIVAERVDGRPSAYRLNYRDIDGVRHITQIQLADVEEHIETTYGDDMPGMTLEEFNSYVDSLVEEIGQ